MMGQVVEIPCVVQFGWHVECLNFRPGQEITDDDYGPYSEPWGCVAFDAHRDPEEGIGLILGASRFGLTQIWKVVRVLAHDMKVECVLASEYQGYGAYECTSEFGGCDGETSIGD